MQLVSVFLLHHDYWCFVAFCSFLVHQKLETRHYIPFQLPPLWTLKGTWSLWEHRTWPMTRRNFFCTLDAISVQELIFLGDVSRSPSLPFVAENATHWPSVPSAVAWSWPGVSETICRDCARWGHPAWSSWSHPATMRDWGTRGAGWVCTVDYTLGMDNRIERWREPGFFQRSRKQPIPRLLNKW